MFRYKSGNVKNLSRDHFLTDKEYYDNILKLKLFIKEEEVLEKDILVEIIISSLPKNKQFKKDID